MTGNEYQKLAMRTAPDISDSDREKHALHGIVSEAGEIHGLYQKVYQGHKIDKEHAKKELGDLMWFVAEFATGNYREWRHFLKLRTSKAVHPQMREVAIPLLEELKSRLPIVFDDIIVE